MASNSGGKETFFKISSGGVSGGGRVGAGSALRSGRERREKATTESNWDRFIDEELNRSGGFT